MKSLRTKTNKSKAAGSSSSQKCQTLGSYKNLPFSSPISKYFTAPNDEFESPYKNSVSEIKCKTSNLDESDDFKTPIALGKEPKVLQKKPQAKKESTSHAKRRKPSKNQNSIVKYTKDNFGNEDVNPEHLQMAIALSKSSFEAENPDEARQRGEVDLERFLGPKKCTTLEKFGFRMGRPKLTPEMKREYNPVTVPKRKNSKFRFITPTLLSRTEVDRQSLISSKMSLVLLKTDTRSDEVVAADVFSDVLRNYKKEAESILKFNGYTFGELNAVNFFITDWEASPSKTRCGCLLKRWEDIPGRDESPIRDAQGCPDGDILSKGDLEISSTTVSRCVSPDLFDSDYESFSPKKQVVDDKSRVYKSDSGIEHFESFCSDSVALYLTQKTCSTHENLLTTSKIYSNDKDLTQSCPSADEYYNDIQLITDHMDIDKGNEPARVLEDNVTSEKKMCWTDRGEDCEVRNEITVDNPGELENEMPSDLVAVVNSSPGLNVTDYVKEMLDRNSPWMAESIANFSEQVPEVDDLPPASQEETSSQETIVISDEELNYSSLHSRDNKNFYSLESSEDEGMASLKEGNLDVVHSDLKVKYSQEIAPVQAALDDTFDKLLRRSSVIESLDRRAGMCETPPNDPSAGKFIIKIKDVTPMGNYAEMDTPRLTQELDKHGIKPMKRRRGVQLLTHIYECTHPVVQPEQIQNLVTYEGEEQRAAKRMKRGKNGAEGLGKRDKNCAGKATKSKKLEFRSDCCEAQAAVEIVGDCLLQDEKLDDLIFERRSSKRIPSCAVPLQIAWFNFVCANPKLQENILCYEPLHLEVISAMLKEQSGFKFHELDLLSFLDRKCIVFRTPQRGNKRRS